MADHQFELEVSQSGRTLATVSGRSVPGKSISLYDLEKVSEVEQFLEKLFGLRFHINQVLNDTVSEAVAVPSSRPINNRPKKT